ncbi:copper chaperone PCu(A)C [Streptomyces inhibens]|uniref:copper chaperone PCu(A)C n=1 Tax=Streptomyces inhibens TaxID=2293571 RepID=UPI001EE72749|nr:copper chaperone PCu(A)C [Streptomyces inhibens]UKY52065.1 copper chaperone PCu(A)C [Streptomyces inhibens]
MSRSLRRGVLAATVLSLSIATLSACGAGNDAQTLQVKPDNAATSAGDIKIQNASVITQPELNAKGPAVIAVTVFNNGVEDQKLTAISVDGTGQSAKLSRAGGGAGPITVPAGGSVVLGGQDNASAVLASGREAVQDGNVQPLTFTFSSTGKVALGAYVVPAKSYFEGYGPSQVPQPSGSASPSGSGKPSETGKPSESGTPTGSATPTGTTKPAGSAHSGH